MATRVAIPRAPGPGPGPDGPAATPVPRHARRGVLSFISKDKKIQRLTYF